MSLQIRQQPIHEIMLGALRRRTRTGEIDESVSDDDSRNDQLHQVDIPGVQPLSPSVL